MRFSAKTLMGFQVHASSDDEIGSCHDLLFDSQTRIVRYLVLKTTGWLEGRQTLIATSATEPIDERAATAGIRLKLSRQQIADAPALRDAMPISREVEKGYYEHYGWTPYWTSSIGEASQREKVEQPAERSQAETIDDFADSATDIYQSEESQASSDLQSAKDFATYTLHASADGKTYVATLEDLIVDTSAWTLDRLVVTAQPPEIAENQFVPANRIREIHVAEKSIFVDATKDQLKEYTNPPFSYKSEPQQQQR